MIPQKILKRFERKYKVSESETVEIFNELESFLDSTSKTEVNSVATKLDMAWHLFILDTKEYLSYCLERYGKVIHHIPNDEESSSTGCNPGNKCGGAPMINNLQVIYF